MFVINDEKFSTNEWVTPLLRSNIIKLPFLTKLRKSEYPWVMGSMGLI